MEHQISYDMLFPTVNTLNNDFPDVDIQRRLVNEEVCYFMIIPDQYTSQQLIMLGMLLGKAYMKLWTIEQIQELPCWYKLAQLVGSRDKPSHSSGIISSNTYN